MANERSASAGNLDWAEFGGRGQPPVQQGVGRPSATWPPPSRDDVARRPRRLLAAAPLVGAGDRARLRRAPRAPRHLHELQPRASASTRPAEPGWCGDCPKCRFVFLALAPFIEPRRPGRRLRPRPARRPGAGGRLPRRPRHRRRQAVRVRGRDRRGPRRAARPRRRAGVGGRRPRGAARARWSAAPTRGRPSPGSPRTGAHGIPERHLRAARALLGARGPPRRRLGARPRGPGRRRRDRGPPPSAPR